MAVPAVKPLVFENCTINNSS